MTLGSLRTGMVTVIRSISSTRLANHPLYIQRKFVAFRKIPSFHTTLLSKTDPRAIQRYGSSRLREWRYVGWRDSRVVTATSSRANSREGSFRWYITLMRPKPFLITAILQDYNPYSVTLGPPTIENSVRVIRA